MIKVPPFLLRRLYVKGSLRNSEQGFEFDLKNTLGSGYGVKLLPLILDGKGLPLENCCFLLDEKETPFEVVSEENPFTLPLNKVITIRVKGVTLSPGPHRIGFSFVVQGLGQLGFDFVDEIK